MVTVAQGRLTARRQALTLAAGVAVIVIAIDQLTKHTIATSIAPNRTIHIIGSVLELVHVRNTGVAFGFLSGGGAVVYAVTAAALVALLTYLLVRPAQRLLWLPTGMLIGGAIGNVIDRVARGSVIDFIKLPHWPAFNLADTSITIGVIVLVLSIEFGGRSRGEQQQ
jgi:signal peptidase II